MGSNEYTITQQSVTLDEYMSLIAEHKLPLLIRLSKEESEKLMLEYKAFSRQLHFDKILLCDLRNDTIRFPGNTCILECYKEFVCEIEKEYDRLFDLTSFVGISQFYNFDPRKIGNKSGLQLVFSFKDTIDRDIITLKQLEMQDGTICEIDATNDKGLSGIYLRVIPTALGHSNRSISTNRLIRELRIKGIWHNKFAGKK